MSTPEHGSTSRRWAVAAAAAALLVAVAFAGDAWLAAGKRVAQLPVIERLPRLLPTPSAPDPPDRDTGLSRPSGDESRIPAGFPDGDTTGLAASALDRTDLRGVGHLTITEDGAVIQGVLADSVRVSADNVTIRDSVIEGASLYALDAFTDDQRGLLVERVDVHQTDPCRKAIYARDAEFREVNAWGGDTVAVLRSHVRVSDSFLHDPVRSPACRDRHHDAVHTQGGDGLHIVGSTLLGPWRGQTSAFIAQSNESPLRDLRLERTFLSGGAYTLYVKARNRNT